MSPNSLTEQPPAVSRSLPDYHYRGARAMVALHSQAMREFLHTWKYAKSVNLAIPRTGQPKYASLDALLEHVFICSRQYIRWLCEAFGLPDPNIDAPPHAEEVERQADSYMEHLLDRWRTPLSQIPEDRFFSVVQTSWWNVEYCADAMLEHAVMHPIRHRFQLLELLQDAHRQ